MHPQLGERAGPDQPGVGDLPGQPGRVREGVDQVDPVAQYQRRGGDGPALLGGRSDRPHQDAMQHRADFVRVRRGGGDERAERAEARCGQPGGDPARSPARRGGRNGPRSAGAGTPGPPRARPTRAPAFPGPGRGPAPVLPPRPAGSRWCPARPRPAPPDPRRARPAGTAPAAAYRSIRWTLAWRGLSLAPWPSRSSRTTRLPWAASLRARPRLRWASSSRPCSQTSTRSPEP